MCPLSQYSGRLLPRCSIKMSDNVIHLDKIRRSKNPVKTVCDAASKEFIDLVIIGEDKEGKIQMITTVPEPADLMWFLKVCEHGILSRGVEDEDE